MNLTLKVWRQAHADDTGSIETYPAKNIPEEASFLEMLDIVNQDIIEDGGDPIHFDHDCREGICGMCSLTINGVPHSKETGITTCQVHMRKFRDGDTIWVEPFRARAFPIVKDLMVDRSAFDRIVAAGGYISVRTGAAPDANSIPIRKDDADDAFDSAACIGCGACVAACKPEKDKRVLGMVRQMDAEGFGNCTNQYECEGVCPKDISADVIAKLNRDFAAATAREAVE
ncbi:MAG: succinate dehydrogenase/fumarate reductase iron-sulfur subunit [Gammaproteobacteria bacterium]|nr:succinate dehydrogenase/fumarate reductase iron-sulfur subunit [Gammaproteobacteria bacterium]